MLLIVTMSERKQVKLCGFNVHNLGRADNCDDATYRSKLDYLADVLGSIDADLVVVDEVREPDSFDELADRLDRYGHRFLADPPDGTRKNPDRDSVQAGGAGAGAVARFPRGAAGQVRRGRPARVPPRDAVGAGGITQPGGPVPGRSPPEVAPCGGGGDARGTAGARAPRAGTLPAPG